MANLRPVGQSLTARRWLGAALCAGLAWVAGCSSTPHAAAPKHDPILGVMEPPGMPKPTTTSPATTSAPQTFQQGGVPAIPTSLTATNPATLAIMSSQGALRDDAGSSGPPFLNRPVANNTQQVPGLPGYIPPNPNPKVEEVPDSKPAGASAPATTWQSQSLPATIQPTGGAATPLTADSLAKQLQDRGVIDQKAEAVPEGVRLTCYVSRGPENGYRILQTTAADYPAAVAAILKQIDATR